MAEVESLCDRIAILSSGHISFLGTIAGLTEKISRRYRIHIKTSKGEECLETENIGSALLEALEEFRKKGTEVMDIKIDRGTLEQHFIEIAKGDSE